MHMYISTTEQIKRMFHGELNNLARYHLLFLYNKSINKFLDIPNNLLTQALQTNLGFILLYTHKMHNFIIRYSKESTRSS